MKSSTPANSNQTGPMAAWLLSGLVSLLALVAWGSSYGWKLNIIGAYQFFPLLGLLAFSLMWAHYMTGFLQKKVWPHGDYKKYFQYTGYAVLAAILFHPGILIFQRFKDGYGLPPGSYTSYLGPSMAWLIMLGSVSLLIFLAYELHRWFENRSWWKYVLYAGDVAMVAVFYHGLRIGGQLMTGWYRGIWFVYGLLLAAVLVYTYVSRFQSRSRSMA